MYQNWNNYGTNFIKKKIKLYRLISRPLVARVFTLACADDKWKNEPCSEVDEVVNHFWVLTSIVLLFLCINQPRSSNPKILTASDFARVTSTTSLLDRLETICMKREKNTTVCNIFTLAKDYHQNLYIKANMFSKQLILQIMTIINSFTSKLNTFCVKDEHNKTIYKSSQCRFL